MLVTRLVGALDIKDLLVCQSCARRTAAFQHSYSRVPVPIHIPLALRHSYVDSLLFLDSMIMTCSRNHCACHCGSELWITYHQASRKHKQTTAQLIDVSERSHLFDLEDVLDHVFQQDFVDQKWRSVVWWEDCAGVRLKASDTVHDLLARCAGSTPCTALRLIIGTFTYGAQFSSFIIFFALRCLWTRQRTARRPSGYTTNTPDAGARRTPRRSASVWTCRTSSWGASGTSQTISLRRGISRAMCVRWCPGKTRAESTSKRVRRWRTYSVGERGRARRSLCVWWSVGYLLPNFPSISLLADGNLQICDDDKSLYGTILV
jgi:hypothetical protein